MKIPTALAASLVLGFALLAGATAAKPALRDQPAITEGLLATAIAYEIGDKCGSLSARILPGILYLNSLKSEAQRLGYTKAEIDAFVDSDEEKDRLESLARTRLQELGGVEGDWASYCTVGQAQIAAGSQIGRLLR